MSQLEAQLKKQMEYSDDEHMRCPNCTNCSPEPHPNDKSKRVLVCNANKALPFEVELGGRCNLFSAKRQRRSAIENATSDNDSDFEELE